MQTDKLNKAECKFFSGIMYEAEILESQKMRTRDALRGIWPDLRSLISPKKNHSGGEVTPAVTSDPQHGFLRFSDLCLLFLWKSATLDNIPLFKGEVERDTGNLS